MVADIHWPTFHAVYQARRSRPLLAELHAESASAVGFPLKTEFTERLARAPFAQRRTLLQEHVQQTLAQILHLRPCQVTPDVNFLELGVDSLLALELRDRLRDQLGSKCTVSPTLVFDYPTVTALAEHLASQVASLAPDRTIESRASLDSRHFRDMAPVLRKLLLALLSKRAPEEHWTWEDILEIVHYLPDGDVDNLLHEIHISGD
ncbi:MAG: hypothetical protein A2W31_10520 [Planctomycetes bacterium RBG_16_64_10]|nr:MAG: hypothetical protein A2W31_10520 [Planctomycetes bacterium RBG_16_64_10]